MGCHSVQGYPAPHPSPGLWSPPDLPDSLGKREQVRGGSGSSPSSAGPPTASEPQPPRLSEVSARAQGSEVPRTGTVSPTRAPGHKGFPVTPRDGCRLRPQRGRGGVVGSAQAGAGHPRAWPAPLLRAAWCCLSKAGGEFPLGETEFPRTPSSPWGHVGEGTVGSLSTPQKHQAGPQQLKKKNRRGLILKLLRRDRGISGRGPGPPDAEL